MKRELIESALVRSIYTVLAHYSGKYHIGNPFSEESFKRFANAILTAYIITGILLMVNMFAYAGSRERPYAPIMGMIIAIMAGIGIGFLLLYNNDIIMEDNGSFQAQALYNIVHIIASGFAMILAVL